MNISSRTLNDFLIFDLDGNIEFEETQSMETYIYSNLRSGVQKVVINLMNVPYLNSSALGSMVRILQNLKGQGISLQIMNINKDISNLFSITGVNRYFSFIEDESHLK